MPARIKLLLAAHFVVLLIACFAAYGQFLMPTPATAFQLSVIFADAGLLALWSGMSAAPLMMRLAVFTLGLLCLVTAGLSVQDQSWEMEESASIVIEILVPAGVMFLFLISLRKARTKLRLIQQRTMPTSQAGTQFSIKHLFAATTAVCIILASGKAVQVWEPFGVGWTDSAILFTVASLCVILVGLATFWGALREQSPHFRLLAIVAASFALGPLPLVSYGFDIHSSADRQIAMAWSAIFGFQAINTAATLFFFRSCGWRLCRGPVEQRPSAAEIAVASEDLEPTTIFDD